MVFKVPASIRPSWRNEGFVLVAVLWILGGLATLATVYAVYAVNASAGLSVDKDRLQVEASMHGALELTAYYLSAVGQQARSSSGSFDLQLAGYRVGVSFISEAARIDLNKAEKPLLGALFRVLGAPPEVADEYADRIDGWRKPSGEEIASRDKEIAAYRAAGLAYDPRQHPFESVQELWLVLGLPPAMVARVMPFVTVFSGAPTVNVLTAAPEVLAALPGMTATRLHEVLTLRSARPTDARAMLADLGSSDASTDAGKTFRVRMDISLPRGHRVTGEAVILLLQDAPDPYRVLSWNDGFDG